MKSLNILAAFRHWLQRRRLERTPVSTTDHLSLQMIDTELGNRLLDGLKTQGWKQVEQYSPLAFDKGIDYDSYRLRRGLDELRLEWDNWLEWTISGPREIIDEIALRFPLKAEPHATPEQPPQSSSPR